MTFVSRLATPVVHLVALLLIAAPVVGQEKKETEKKEPPAAKKADDKKAGDEKKPEAKKDPAQPQLQGFDAIFTRFQALEDENEKINKRYAEAGTEVRRTLFKQYTANLAELKTLLPKLRAAAIEAYAKEPNKNDAVTKTLVGLLYDDARNDRYDEALKVGKMLADNKCAVEQFHSYYGIALYSTDRFAEAKVQLEKGKAAGVNDRDAAGFLQLVDEQQTKWEREKKLREAEAAANDLPRVRMKTSKGELLIELYENEAPDTVGNFISLVEKGFYNSLTFHRVIPGFMAQGGCPDGNGQGGPGYKIFCECVDSAGKPNKKARMHFRGTLSMAHAGPNTGGSQFFLTFRPTPHLDGRHTVFGRVIEGLEVLDRIQRRDPRRGQPQADTIITAKVERKRDHEYKPNKAEDKKP